MGAEWATGAMGVFCVIEKIVHMRKVWLILVRCQHQWRATGPAPHHLGGQVNRVPDQRMLATGQLLLGAPETRYILGQLAKHQVGAVQSQVPGP